ncbi:hypothetical protein [Xenorhabdus bharatensis]|uniref:hypothetical protein n=1 Tax=Xenorhabdus bharatensis TaxID=3136256 RepID=UPI0030F3D4F0
MDNLIVSFSYHIRAVMNVGKIYASMAQMDHSYGVVIHFPKLAKFLKWFPNRNPHLMPEELNEIAYSFLPKV